MAGLSNVTGAQNGGHALAVHARNSPNPRRQMFINASVGRRWTRKLLVRVASALLAAAPFQLAAQALPVDSVRIGDSTVVHRIRLKDGSELIGRIVAVTADSVRVASSASSSSISRAAIRDVREYPVTALRNGELWFDNPHVTRLLFSPTAIPLEKGEGYFSDFWLFLVSASVGVNDRFSLGGGMTLFPGVSLNENVFYALPKYTVVNRPTFKVAAGGLFALVGGFDSEADDSRSLGVLYGVATVGKRESNLTLGSGWGYVGSNVSSRPVLTLGGQHRVSRRVALISENWFIPFENDQTGVLSYGLRFLGEKLAVDFAFANPLEDGASFFPGFPLLGFAIKF